MKVIKNPRGRLSLLLILVAIHSFCVGVGLIIRPAELMELFGFGMCYERFFPTQGGVFHIVMAVGYLMAAYNVDQYRCLVIFSIIVKIMATVCLFTYFIAVEQIWLVLMSGFSDGLMGMAIYVALLLYLKSRKSQKNPELIRKIRIY
jgi:hypothetical protein